MGDEDVPFNAILAKYGLPRVIRADPEETEAEEMERLHLKGVAYRTVINERDALLKPTPPTFTASPRPKRRRFTASVPVVADAPGAQAPVVTGHAVQGGRVSRGPGISSMEPLPRLTRAASAASNTSTASTASLSSPMSPVPPSTSPRPRGGRKRPRPAKSPSMEGTIEEMQEEMQSLLDKMAALTGTTPAFAADQLHAARREESRQEVLRILYNFVPAAEGSSGIVPLSLRRLRWGDWLHNPEKLRIRLREVVVRGG
jgi:hypothetical protein